MRAVVLLLASSTVAACGDGRRLGGKYGATPTDPPSSGAGGQPGMASAGGAGQPNAGAGGQGGTSAQGGSGGSGGEDPVCTEQSSLGARVYGRIEAGHLETGDLNADGVLDLASESGVLLGNGDGSFQDALLLGWDSHATAVALGDVNGDEKLDWVGALWDYDLRDNVAGIAAGNGDGTFQPIQVTRLGKTATSLALSDLDSDGDLDLVFGRGSLFYAGDNRVEAVTILLNQGDGSLEPPVEIATADYPSFVTTSDLNGDSVPDLVFTQRYFEALEGAAIGVLLGRGDATFEPPLYTAAGDSEPTRIAIGDLDNDATPDLAVASWSAGVVLRGSGDGTFDSAGAFGYGTIWPAGSLRPMSLLIDDLDADGQRDLVATTKFENKPFDSSVHVWRGDGHGDFGEGRSYAAGDLVADAVIADFDGDERLDMAVGLQLTSDTVSVLLGNGDGTLQGGRRIVTGSASTALRLEDVNRDDHLDMILASPDMVSNHGSIALGNGDGTFQSYAYVDLGGDWAASLAVGDIDGDQELDVVAGNYYSGDGSWLRGLGDGAFGEPQSLALDEPPALLVQAELADLDGNAAPDLVVARDDATDLVVLLGNGGGSFTQSQAIATGIDPDITGWGDVYFALGELNEDGRVDLVVADTKADRVAVLMGNGLGRFEPWQNFPAGDGPRSPLIGDANGDGHSDVLVLNNEVGSDENGLNVLLGHGDGSFAGPQRFAAGKTPSFAALGDLDLDGNLDVAVANRNANYVSVVHGNGDGSFRAAENYATAEEPSAVVIRDVDGDGRPDLAVAHRTGYGVYLLTGSTRVRCE